MEFRPAAVVLMFAALVFLTVFGQRWRESRQWRGSLLAYRLRLPDGLSHESITGALSVIAVSTARWPIAFEIIADHRGIQHYVLIPDHMSPGTLTRFTTGFPGIRLEQSPDYLATFPKARLARELRTTRLWRPLASQRSQVAIAGVLAAMYPLGSGEVIRVQWIVSATRRIRASEELPSEALRDIANKQAAPLADACGRVAVSASHRARAALLLAGVMNALAAVNGPHSAIRGRVLPTRVVAGRLQARSVPLTLWPALLNAEELTALVGFPTEGIRVPGLAVGSARQLPPSVDMRRTGLVVAMSNYPGMRERPLALATDDRLRHALIQGPTGSGKSELIARLALQDIRAGHGTVVIDPKSDLIEQILRRIPDDRMNDVIVMDASSLGRPVGFNILGSGRDEHSKELVVDRIVYVLAELWRSSWGPRTADVLRSCLLSLVYAKAPDGSAFTLVEIPQLLTDEAFRRQVMRQKIPESVRQFWAAYEAMSEPERAQVIGPAINKIRTFTTRSALRLMLGQSTGINLGAVFRERKILLVPLSKGVIGPEAAHLLGSLLVAFLWQETLGRATVAAEKRRPAFAYLDEFQEFIRFGSGGELADMLAQARGLGLGLTLAYQYLDQLSADVTAAVLGTVRTQVVFQLEYRDAETMAKRFTPLTRQDLTGLDAFEVAMRPCVDARTMAPVTGLTMPLDEPLRDASEVLDFTLDRYGVPRADVEAACQARIRPAISIVPPIGRVAGGHS
ncbi:type IV secretory system conjugative DNA transfer family protein [Actinomadura craniellae]|uniref:Type IV secretory system conjugative DNA transfer family protein n=1 Tax=Actinomadura craniellae TaxID=2231787 RepID=A0A365H3W7_9ACTN|nr:DEAD/DEAH box helicase [Actinomadura craniellae]RAY13739.1 type IV secretory system conjugative DNA transfer family protein [Actinomadura craniellae]